MFEYISGAIAILICLKLGYDQFFNRPLCGKNKVIVVTGCDNKGSFGQLSVEKLVEKGFNVYATYFTIAGKESLLHLNKEIQTKASLDGHHYGIILPVRLDITSEKSVTECFSYLIADLRKRNWTLWALVNNAGVHDGLFIDWTPVEVFQKVMEVNFFGMVRLTKAFLPELKRTQGRIINLTSLDGYRPLPTTAAYTCSKHAADAFTSCLRWEMKWFGISVHTINPGTFKTDLSVEAHLRIEKLWQDKLTEDTKVEYGMDFFNKVMELTQAFTAGASTKVHLVGDAVAHACTSQRPCRRYFPGYDAKFFWKPVRDFVPEVVLDMIIDIVIALGFPRPLTTMKEKRT